MGNAENADFGLEDAHINEEEGKRTADDREVANAASDKAGWKLESAEDDTKVGTAGYTYGYFTVNMRRALATSQPTEDPQIEADETNCDTGYYYGTSYEYSEDEPDVETDDLKGFMPSAACVTCLNEGRCTDKTIVVPVVEPVVEPDNETDSEADGEKDSEADDEEDSEADDETDSEAVVEPTTEPLSEQKDDGSMTLAAALGATTSVLALIAF